MSHTQVQYDTFYIRGNKCVFIEVFQISPSSIDMTLSTVPPVVAPTIANSRLYYTVAIFRPVVPHPSNLESSTNMHLSVVCPVSKIASFLAQKICADSWYRQQDLYE